MCSVDMVCPSSRTYHVVKKSYVHLWTWYVHLVGKVHIVCAQEDMLCSKQVAMRIRRHIIFWYAQLLTWYVLTEHTNTYSLFWSTFIGNHYSAWIHISSPISKPQCWTGALS